MPLDKKQLTKLVKDVEDLTTKLGNFMRTSETFDTGAGKDIAQIQKDITEIKILVTNNYVRREEFTPVQKIVYGLVSVILLTVVGALMVLVIR